jgi:hypothetical protein
MKISNICGDCVLPTVYVSMSLEPPCKSRYSRMAGCPTPSAVRGTSSSMSDGAGPGMLESLRHSWNKDWTFGRSPLLMVDLRSWNIG